MAQCGFGFLGRCWSFGFLTASSCAQLGWGLRACSMLLVCGRSVLTRIGHLYTNLLVVNSGGSVWGFGLLICLSYQVIYYHAQCLLNRLYVTSAYVVANASNSLCFYSLDNSPCDGKKMSLWLWLWFSSDRLYWTLPSQWWDQQTSRSSCTNSTATVTWSTASNQAF